MLGFPGAAQAVLPFLDDPAPEVQWTAASVLGRLGGPEVPAALRARLADQHAEVRRQAALGLGYLKAPNTRPALAELAHQDPSAKVRAAAAYAASLLDDAD